MSEALRSGVTDRPWLGSYPPGMPSENQPAFTDMLALFAATVEAHGSDDAIRYFDGTLTFDELQARSDAFAVHLLAHGLSAGDRVALYLQNNPSFVIALLGAWKAGGAAVVVNPMYRQREVGYLLADSGATVLVCLDELYDVVTDIVRGGETRLRHVVVSSPRDDQRRDDERILPADAPLDNIVRFRDATDASDRKPPLAHPEPDDVAVLMYTSGTTGKPKGAMITHRGLAFSSQTYRDWIGIGPEDRILGVAPLFHITGLVGHVGAGLLTGAALILNHRFDPTVLLELIREHRPTFTVGSITVFNNLASRSDISPHDFSSFRAVFSGGAPIAPALRDTIRDRTGISLHNFYGMTETTSPAIGVPLGDAGRVDPLSGALSIGIPVFNTTARIIDENRRELPPGEIGEIAISGPQVVPAYWERPEESAEKIASGEIATGDVGFMDEDGWFYLVDRKSDMIIAAGYKVWPREVEDVLYTHPAVREAAVVGVPDEYRGETVKAFISLKPGSTCTAEEIIEFCKSQMAAYKYPRLVEFSNDLPKAVTGKILRRELRAPSK
ncbi:class I adenylate-forming enzyme family protein [Rhodococcus sp. NPDC057529]|uniref:class I adenylate-forming enzyme family protein n=1 Tax=Rhodococcus sp. NPDC057529 TaxID=3346158 RepID=UPI00366B48AD